MRVRKISWGMSGRILAGLLMSGLVAYALWPPPQFNFLRGHQPVRINDFVFVYKLSGDSVELNQRIDRELTGRGFRRITEQRWPTGSKVEYRSGDKMTQAFLVSETDQDRPASFWISSSKQRTRLSMITRDLVSMLNFTSRCRASPINECIANLKQIEGAEATWALENPRMTNEIPRDADLFGPQAYIRVKPQCPEGGEYTIGKIGEPPRCSNPWHGLE